MHIRYQNGLCWLVVCIIGICIYLFVQPAEATDINFHGTLVAEPCTLQPGDEDALLEFGTILDKYLYLNGRTNSKPLTLHLLECDISQSTLVKIRFTGVESVALPGYLAFDSGSQARGAAVGFETQDGAPLFLGIASPAFKLTEGGNVIALNAFVRGEPDALAQQALARGPFSAVATFHLEYE